MTGNVIPPMWYQTMTYRTQRGTYPHLLAINVLADVCYWYRPREIREEKTGRVKLLEKRFKGDRLQRSFKQICKQFGCTDPQAREAVAFLEARKLVLKEYMHGKGGRNNWQMYIEPIVPAIKAHTYPEKDKLAVFDFIEKQGREFVDVREQVCKTSNSHENQVCEFAKSQNPQVCEFENTEQDCEFTTSEFVNSQPSIYTENTLTESNVITLTGNNSAAPNGAAQPSAKRKIKTAAAQPKREKPEIHLAIDVFLEEREKWLRLRNPGREIEKDELHIDWTGKEIGMLKKLGTSLKAKARAANYDYGGAEGYAENLLRLFLRKYAALNEWYCDAFLASHIVTHFNRIYSDVKQGKTTNSASAAASTNYREALANVVAGL